MKQFEDLLTNLVVKVKHLDKRMLVSSWRARPMPIEVGIQNDVCGEDGVGSDWTALTVMHVPGFDWMVQPHIKCFQCH